MLAAKSIPFSCSTSTAVVHSVYFALNLLELGTLSMLVSSALRARNYLCLSNGGAGGNDGGQQSNHHFDNVASVPSERQKG